MTDTLQTTRDIHAPSAARRAGIALAVLGLAALSLLGDRTPAFDPTAWLIWGREVAHGSLSTVSGPSWKPLPVALTTLLAPLGRGAAPEVWLVITRAAGLTAILLAARVARRLGAPRWGAVAAAALLALATDFLYDAGRGGSEGLLVLLGLCAVDLHARGRARAAFTAGAAAALIRPEIAPVLVLWGMWLVARRGRRPGDVVLVAAAGLAVVALWLAPERIGSGDWLGAATRARVPTPDTPSETAFPFATTFLWGATTLALPAFAGALAAVVRARRRVRRGDADRIILATALAALLFALVVALLAQAGFTGNSRYLTLPAALLCVLAGVGLPAVANRLRALRRPAVRRVAYALAAGSVALSAFLVGHRAVELRDDQRLYGEQLPALIARAGGPAAVRRCGPVGASLLQRMAVAWRLGTPADAVREGIDPHVRTVLALGGTDAGHRRSSPPVRLAEGAWVLRSSCPLP